MNIIANPNCSTIQAVVALKPLDDKYKIKRIVYSTYQAVSGAGKLGVTRFRKWSCKNIFTIIKIFHTLFLIIVYLILMYFLYNGYTKEEEKMINETRKILDQPNLPITCYLC